MRKNIAGQVVTAQLISSSDGSNVTSGTTNVFVLGDGGTQAAGGGTVTHEGNGTWSYTPTQAETNYDHVVFTFTNASAISAAIQVYTISFDPHNAASLGLTNLDATVSSRSTFNAAVDAVATVTSVTNDVGITQAGADKVWGTTTRALTDKAGFTIAGTKTTLDSLNDITAASVWAVTTRALTDKAGFTLASLPTIPANWITATGIASGALNNKGNWNIGKTGYSLTTLPTIPANWITASGINAGAFNGKGDWNIGKTGYSLTQTFPTNFADLAITATTGRVTVGTNNDKTGYSISGTKTTLDALNDIAATDVVSNGAINTLAGAVVNVDLVDTCTTNTDMRGTDNALLAASAPTNFSSMTISGSGVVDSFVQGFLDTTLTETTAGRIAGNFDTFFENADAATTKVVDDVGTAVSGGGEFTPTEKNQIRYRLGLDGTATAPTASPDLAQKSDISALNDFDPTSESVTINAASVDAIWDEPRTGHTTAGTFGLYLDAQVSSVGGGSLTQQDIRDAMKLAPTAGTPAAGSVDEHLDEILTDTSTTIPAQITGLNNISASDVWSHVTRSLTDKAGFTISGTITTLDGLNNFDPATDTVAHVTLVDTVTTNTDMRGTDSALLASSYITPPTVSAIADGVWDEAQAGHTTVGTFGYFLDSQVSAAGGSSLTAADVWTYGTRSLTDKAGFTISGTKTTLDALNDLSFNDIWTGQLTESYAADGVAPTPTQALFLMNQFHQDFGITGTTYSVKRLDGTTVAATFTLDDATNPTSITRSS